MPVSPSKSLVKPLAVSTDKFGRPSKLTPEVLDKGWQYLTDVMSVSPNAGGLLPTKEGLAIAINVHRETVNEWAKLSEDFSDILHSVEKSQAERLIQFSLIGKYNPTIAKLLLSKHDYVEKSEVDNKHQLVQPIVGGLAKSPAVG